MDLAEALDWLAAHDNLEANPASPTAGDVHGLSLDRMRGIVDVLGNPHLAAPAIHITGTNGKGSVARMVTAVLGAHGLTAGTFTSPHLERVNQRIRRNSDDITDDELAEVLTELSNYESLFPERPSWFELLTAAAFSWFAREAVEVQVLEVGMLGRFDATNVVHADVAVVTNVARDHTDGQGDWRRAIAEEKAGIIESDSAVVLGAVDDDLVDVIAAEGGRSRWMLGQELEVLSSRVAFGGRVFDLRTPTSTLEELFVPAHGEHQVDNAAVAVGAVEAFFDRPLDRDVVVEGLAAVELPGRFEVRARTPLVVVDTAHNPHGVATTAQTLADEFRIAGRLHLVVGFLAGRDLHDVVAPLVATKPASITVVEPDSARAVPAQDVADAVRRVAETTDTVIDVDARPGRSSQIVADLLRQLVDECADEDAIVIVGSTYLAGAARIALRALGVGD